jgi:hypothetical protein
VDLAVFFSLRNAGVFVGRYGENSGSETGWFLGRPLLAGLWGRLLIGVE